MSGRSEVPQPSERLHSLPHPIIDREGSLVHGLDTIPKPRDIALLISELPDRLQIIGREMVKYHITPEQYAVIDPDTNEIQKVYEMARIGEGAVVVINRLAADGSIETLLHWEDRLVINKQGRVELKKVLACRRGHKDPEDANLQTTAYREALEESGRDPYEMIYLGEGAQNLSISPDKGEIWEAHVTNDEEREVSPEKDPGIELREIWVLLDDAFEMQFDDLLTEVALKRSYVSHKRMKRRLYPTEDPEQDFPIQGSGRRWNPTPPGTRPIIKEPHTDIEDPPETQIVRLIPEKPGKKAA